MKSQLLFLSISTLIAFTACKKTDCECASQNTLEGKWHMDSVYGGLQGITLSYATGEVIWDFKPNQGTVEVTNNILTTGPKSIYARFSTGVYGYYIQNTNGQEILFVDSTALGVYTINASTLVVDDGLAADGFVTEFVR
jgi:hypothetical protein